MRMTLRSWTWEYGPLLTVPAGLLIMWLNIFVLPPAAAVPLSVLHIAYVIYCWRIGIKYPRRSDLPEWKTHWRFCETMRRASRRIPRVDPEED